MLEQKEGSRAVADAVALCRPEVICAYPISPQTHIVEALSDLVRTGELTPCEYVNVESEFAAMSVAIGASAAGARAYTATASQGLLYMAEALYNASGLGLPIVMTVANRAIGAPINIWNDHSDSMSQRDSGWIQLYAETNQEALDLHIQAFRLAEELSLPVMVCMDGFILTHAVRAGRRARRQEQVDAFLPPYEPRQVLDPAEPVTIGAMVGPEAFSEVKYLAHAKQMQALDLIPEIAAEFEATFGRDSGGLVRRLPHRDAETVVVALGSVLGTIQDVVDELRDEGVSIGALGIKSFRPFPLEEVRAALAGAQAGRRAREGARRRHRRDRSARTCGSPCRGIQPHGYDVIAGLGGRPITKRVAARLFADAVADRLEPLTFLDMDWELVERELERTQHDAPVRPARREHAARHRRSSRPVALRRAADALPADQVLPSGQLRGRQPPARPRPALGAGARRPLQLAHLGPPRLPGLRRGARRALRARRRDARHRQQLIAANATGCLEVFSTPYPESSWQLPWIHSLFGNAPAVATGIAAALKVEGPRGRARGRPGRRRRHGRHRLRLPVGDVRAQRRRALHLLRQRGLHEHRRAALRRHAARRAHGDHASRSATSPATSSARARTRR